MTTRINVLFVCILIATSSNGAAPIPVDTGASATQIRISLIATSVSNSLRRSEPLPREMLADKIEVRHVPAMQGDPEIIDKQQFGSDLPALKRALKDFHMDVVSTALEANAFTVKLTLVGTRVSGVRYSSPMSLRFIVADGVITGLDAAQDPAERALLGEIAAEGEFRTPPRD